MRDRPIKTKLSDSDGDVQIGGWLQGKGRTYLWIGYKSGKWQGTLMICVLDLHFVRSFPRRRRDENKIQPFV